MMWKKIYEIDDVKSTLNFFNNYLAYLDRERHLILRSLDGYAIEHRLEYGDDGLIFIFDNQLYVRKAYELLKLDNSQLISHFRSDSKTVYPQSSNLVEVYSTANDGSKVLEMYDVRASKCLWERGLTKSFRSSFSSSDGYFIVGLSWHTLHRVDMLTGETIWKKEFPADQELENCPLFVKEDMVIVHNEGGYVRGLDLETGRLQWELDNCHSFHTPHAETGHLHGVSTIRKETYEVIDPIRGERIVDAGISDVLKTNNLSTIICHMHSLTPDSLYFKVRSFKNRNINFGKIDLESKMIEYIETLEGDDHSLSKPIYHEGRLYFIQDNHLLRVFEQE